MCWFAPLTMALVLSSLAPPDSTIRFEKHVLLDRFTSEGVAVGDVNRDGRMDVLAGAYWFEAPRWTPHEIRPPKHFPGGRDAISDSFLNYTLDVDQDGWVDFIRIGFPGRQAYWYRNPQGAAEHWSEHLLYPVVRNESPGFYDVDGDGRGDLLFADEGGMLWLQSPQAPGTTTWTRHGISGPGAPGTEQFSHGLGWGDVNGDGRADAIVREGWWEAPADPAQVGWTFHPAPLGEDCAQMYAYDFDGDGDADVVSSSAHNYGLWWYEQKPDALHGAAWTRHLIDSSFSQTHALALADINRDGLPDLVTGKRPFPHGGKDPGAYEPAVLYWFALERTAAGPPRWVPHLIDSASGVGLQVVAQDLTGDGRVDIAVANKNGVLVFEQGSDD